MAASDPDPALTAVQALLDKGAQAEADQLLVQLIAGAPEVAAFWRERSWIALRRGDLVHASEFAAEAFRLNPSDGRALNALASCALQSDMASEAAELAQLALRVAPDDPVAGMILAMALSLQGRFADAFEALSRLPETGEVLFLRAKILASVGANPEALAMVDAGLAQTPQDDEARLLRATVLQDLVRHEEALQELAGVLERSHDHPRARWLRGMSRVALGDWGGYVDLEARLEASGRYQPPASLTQPAWRPPVDLNGRSILIHCEQGLGDTVQFCRFAPRLVAMGAQVHMMVRPPLLRLMRSMPDLASLSAVGDPPPATDYRVSVMSLPGLLGIDAAALSPFSPYLAPDPQLQTRWAARLGDMGTGGPARPRIGLVWSGGVHPDSPETFAMNTRRNIALEALAPLLRQDVTFVGLQVGAEAEAEHAAFSAAHPELAFRNLGPELGDMADTAAVISLLDLIITVDTSVVHVAGALGAPTWMLNRRDSCWRWMQQRTDSPWYPSLTQFRQGGDSWEPVVEEMVAALAEAFDLPLQTADTLDVAALLERAVDALNAGDLERAEALARAAVSQDPDHAAARNTLAWCLIQGRAFAAAAEEAAAAVMLDPALAPAHNHLGLALNAIGRPEGAVEAFGEALRLVPRDLAYGLNLANALEAVGQLDEAMLHLDATRRVHPAATAVYLVRADVLQKLQRYPEALDCYETAIDLAPDDPMAHWWYSLCLLLTGRHAEGWREFEWRLKGSRLGPPQRPRPMPQWQGEDLTGRSILVHAEQGFGDAIQFARYVPLLQKTGAEVVVEAYPPLVELFATLAGSPTVVATGQPFPAVDFHCPFMSLPFALLADQPDIPADTPYLSVPPAAAARWATRFDPVGGPLVGLVCSGRPTHPNDANRSMSLDVLAQALPPGPRYVLLQQELREADAEVLNQRPDIVCLKDELRDFSDTAAACSHMDLVISVDTSVAHLAGALGCPLLLLLPFQPEWRWGLGSDTCPWYPTARLLRQSAFGDWSDPLASVTAAVSVLLQGDSA